MKCIRTLLFVETYALNEMQLRPNKYCDVCSSQNNVVIKPRRDITRLLGIYYFEAHFLFSKKFENLRKYHFEHFCLFFCLIAILEIFKKSMIQILKNTIIFTCDSCYLCTRANAKVSTTAREGGKRQF